MDHKYNRKRIGILVPSSNTVMENDLHDHLNKDHYTVHTARMYLERTTPEAEKEMMEQYSKPAAEQLKTLFPDLLIFGCTSASSLFGHEYDKELTSRLGSITDSKCIGVLECAIDSLNRRNAKRIAVFTPYIDDINRTIKDSFERAGINVIDIHGMQIDNNFKLAEVKPDEIVNFINENYSKENIDLIFISCTNFRSLEAKEKIEEILSIPVITSNLAVIEAIGKYFGKS